METMNIFDMMGLGAPTAPAEKKAKAPEKKTEDSKKSTSKKTGSKEEPKVTLPVRVIAGAWNCELEGEGEKKLSEIAQLLVERGYDELKSTNVALKASGGCVLIGLPGTKSPDKTEVSGDMVVAAGGFKYEHTSEGEGTKLGVIKEQFIENNPQYTGCGLYYDAASSIAIPAGEKDEEIAKDKEYSIIVNGEVQSVIGSGIAEALSVPKEEEKNIKLYPVGQNYLPVLVVKDQTKGRKISAEAEKKKDGKIEVTLPATITFTHAADRELTSDMFDGKTVVTNEDIQEWLFKQYEEYTAEKTELLYFKKDNIVEARIKSSKRG